MAEPITIQKLIDASMDSDSLEVLVNGDESTQVTTRLGETYPSVKKAIKTMFENGGFPATPFKTKTEMESSALEDASYAVVIDDQLVFNGVYYKNNGSWSKAAWNSSKELSEAALDVLLNIFPQEEINTSSNLVDGLDYQSGYYNTSDDPVGNSTYLHTNLIEVQHDQTYVIDVSKGQSSLLNFYDATETFISSASKISYKLSPEKLSGLVAVSPPSNTKYVRVSFPARKEFTMIFCKASSLTISPKLNLSDTKSRAALTKFIRSLTQTGYRAIDADNLYKTLTKDNWVHGEYLATREGGGSCYPK